MTTCRLGQSTDTLRSVRWMLGTLVLLAFVCVRGASAVDQAMPDKLPAGHPPIDGAAESMNPHGGLAPHGGMPGMELPGQPTNPIAAQDRSRFAREINLSRFRLLCVHHGDRVKTLDSWARQSLAEIRNKQSIDGQDPLYTALDLAFRPEAWENKNIIYVQAIPIRQDIARFAADGQEAERILRQATVSPAFIAQPEVGERLREIERQAQLSEAAGRVIGAWQLCRMLELTLGLVPPAPPARDLPWQHPYALRGNVPGLPANAPPVPGYSAKQAAEVLEAYDQLRSAWRANDVDAANLALVKLDYLLPTLNPQAYPSATRARVEYWYNRSFNGTIVALVYMVAFALFTVSAMAGLPKVRIPALIFFTLAVLCHVAAMGVRAYLAGRIPVQNQFESVLGAALLGCVVGMALELWKKNSLFGMATSIVGFLAMTACFVFPYVVGTDMGATIHHVAGILGTAKWRLWVHVNMVISSYALIFASATLGLVYLGAKLWHWMNPLADDGQSGRTRDAATLAIVTSRRGFLGNIDAANVVVMQMAFWLLGVGILMGAWWADVSWGRPWGWDPKETFALVTWLVYLIIIHVRLFVPRLKEGTTAGLSIVGCAIMLFNWIGVNFFLVGLHSYA